MFKAKLLQVLAAQLGIALSALLLLVARKAEKALIDAAQIADSVARSGEWMWATARSVEQGESLYIYAYATRSEQKWLFDMHIINPGEPPSFGWDVPHMYVPMSAIFIAVYTSRIVVARDNASPRRSGPTPCNERNSGKKGDATPKAA